MLTVSAAIAEQLAADGYGNACVRPTERSGSLLHAPSGRAPGQLRVHRKQLLPQVNGYRKQNRLSDRRSRAGSEKHRVGAGSSPGARVIITYNTSASSYDHRGRDRTIGRSGTPAVRSTRSHRHRSVVRDDCGWTSPDWTSSSTTARSWNANRRWRHTRRLVARHRHQSARTVFMRNARHNGCRPTGGGVTSTVADCPHCTRGRVYLTHTISRARHCDDAGAGAGAPRHRFRGECHCAGMSPETRASGATKRWAKMIAALPLQHGGTPEDGGRGRAILCAQRVRRGNDT